VPSNERCKAFERCVELAKDIGNCNCKDDIFGFIGQYETAKILLDEDQAGSPLVQSYSGVVCPFTTDYFSLWMMPGQELTIQLSFLEEGSPLSFRLTDGANDVATASEKDGYWEIFYTAATKSPVYIIISRTAVEGNSYSLSVNLLPYL